MTTTPPKDQTPPKPATVGSVARQLQEQRQRPLVADVDRPPGACFSGGCPCAGTVDVGSSGRLYCVWHSYAPPDRWGPITTAMHQQIGILEHIAELMRLRGISHDRVWRAAAAAYWREQPGMEPQPGEDFGRYVWRLREEFAYRIGARNDSPAPRGMQADEPEFANRRGQLALEAA